MIIAYHMTVYQSCVWGIGSNESDDGSGNESEVEDLLRPGKYLSSNSALSEMIIFLVVGL